MLDISTHLEEMHRVHLHRAICNNIYAYTLKNKEISPLAVIRLLVQKVGNLNFKVNSAQQETRGSVLFNS